MANGVIDVFTPEIFNKRMKESGIKHSVNIVVHTSGRVCGFIYEDGSFRFDGKEFPKEKLTEFKKLINTDPEFKIV